MKGCFIAALFTFLTPFWLAGLTIGAIARAFAEGFLEAWKYIREEARR